MTTLPIPASAGAGTKATFSLSSAAPTRQGFAQAFRSEVTKLRTLHSTMWALLVTVAGALLVTALSAAHVSRLGGPKGAGNFGDFDPTNRALTGIALASLTLGVLGVLTISGEYGSGTMRSSLSAIPRRSTFIAAKVSVMALLSLIVGEILTFSCFFLGQGIMSGKVPTASLGQPGVLRAVVLSGAYLALLSLFALGLGLIVRHTAGGIAAFVGCTLLSSILLQALAGNPARFAPENILANSVAAVVPQQGQLSAGFGFAMMAVYTAVALGVGMLLLVRRDA
jgi:ABC-type transport system involved in multi-copper enzyme maturation permease subunit